MVNRSTTSHFNKAHIHETEDKMVILKKLISQEKSDEGYLGDQLSLIFKSLANQITGLENNLSNLSLESKRTPPPPKHSISNFLVVKLLQNTKNNSKLSDRAKEYYHAVFNICKYGIDEIHNKMSLVNNNIRMDLSLNLEQLKDIHKKKITELKTKFKTDLDSKVQEWYSVENSIGKVRGQGGSNSDQLEEKMIRQTIQEAQIEQRDINQQLDRKLG